MPSPLIDALTTRHGYPTVNEATVDAFLRDNEDCVLFFAGDAERLVESDDVAVILPEIVKQFPQLKPALVEKPAERTLQLQYRFNAFPALVFLRKEGYLGAISRLLGWQEYLSEVRAILARDPSEPPPYKFPERCVPQNSGAEGHQPGEVQ